MKTGKTGVSVTIPADIWQSLTEIRSQLDASCPGTPTPIEEAIREIAEHYKSCPRVESEMETFCERAKAWKRT
jgi:hypothetical protein